ncbi:MAG: hypothetical protein RR945_10325 [Erysipelotrichaceae bacterium]
MRLDKIRKKKMTWINLYVFGYLSYQYFGTKKATYERICDLERIFLLIQVDSLNQYNVPIIPYKIYTDDNYIYIRYLSDLLRVAPPESVKDDYYFIYQKVQGKYEYSNMLKRYSKLSSDELRKQVDNVLKSSHLCEKYFVKGRYNKNDMRRCARLQSSKRGWIVAFCGFFGGIGILFTIGGLLKTIGVGLFSYELAEILPVLFFTYPLLCISVFYGWRIMNKKTKYEVNYDFD